MLKRLAIACFIAGAAQSALADPLADCTRGGNAAARMRTCSEVIAKPGYSAEEKARAYRIRGSAHADAGASEKALADLNEAIRLRPEAPSFAARGRTRLALRDYKGAVADYDEALRLTPATASLYAGRGRVRFVQGDLPGAITDFTEALRLDPKSASIFNQRGLAYRKAGQSDRAIEDYTSAILLNPVYALAYNNRGYVYESQGRKDEAIADFSAALLFDPSLTGARDGLIRLGVPTANVAETEKRVAQGKLLVARNCSGCHAVGLVGQSPNSKAPEFRNLHARHPNLALREPLSRGIAAPHEEMPNFALSNEEVDSIIAYINSLARARVKVAKNGATPVADDATDFGDASKGRAYAQRTCSGCHNIQASDAPSPNARAPSFRKVANTPGMTVTALTVWSRTPHTAMPNLIIEPKDMDDLIAYILSLKTKR